MGKLIFAAGHKAGQNKMRGGERRAEIESAEVRKNLGI